MPNLMPRLFGTSGKLSGRAIVFTDPTSQKPFMAFATSVCPDMHLVGAAAGAVTLGMQSLNDAGSVDNVTGWALGQFRKHYQAAKAGKGGPQRGSEPYPSRLRKGVAHKALPGGDPAGPRLAGEAWIFVDRATGEGYLQGWSE